MSKGSSKAAIIMADVAATPTAFGEVRDFSFNVDKKTIDVTPMDDEWEELLHGSKSWGASVTVFYDPSDAVQGEIETSIMTGNTDVELTIRPQGTGTGKKEYTGNAIVTNWSPAGAKDDSVGLTLELKGNGALTPATQSA